MNKQTKKLIRQIQGNHHATTETIIIAHANAQSEIDVEKTYGTNTAESINILLNPRKQDSTKTFARPVGDITKIGPYNNTTLFITTTQITSQPLHVFSIFHDLADTITHWLLNKTKDETRRPLHTNIYVEEPSDAPYTTILEAADTIKRILKTHGNRYYNAHTTSIHTFQTNPTLLHHLEWVR